MLGSVVEFFDENFATEKTEKDAAKRYNTLAGILEDRSRRLENRISRIEAICETIGMLAETLEMAIVPTAEGFVIEDPSLNNTVGVGCTFGTATVAAYGLPKVALAMALQYAASLGLTGAAAYTKAMAILGGGSIATGGGGMAAGSNVLNYIGVGAPIIIITTVWAYNSYQRAANTREYNSKSLEIEALISKAETAEAELNTWSKTYLKPALNKLMLKRGESHV